MFATVSFLCLLSTPSSWVLRAANQITLSEHPTLLWVCPAGLASRAPAYFLPISPRIFQYKLSLQEGNKRATSLLWCARALPNMQRGIFLFILVANNVRNFIIVLRLIALTSWPELLAKNMQLLSRIYTFRIYVRALQRSSRQWPWGFSQNLLCRSCSSPLCFGALNLIYGRKR